MDELLQTWQRGIKISKTLFPSYDLKSTRNKETFEPKAKTKALLK